MSRVDSSRDRRVAKWKLIVSLHYPTMFTFLPSASCFSIIIDVGTCLCRIASFLGLCYVYNTHRRVAAGIRDIVAMVVWRSHLDTISGAALIFVPVATHLLEAARTKHCSC